MQPINFVLIFALGLLLAIFSLQNPDFATIHVFGDVQFQAPLGIELILTFGFGAVFAWVFNIWNGIQRWLETWPTIRELRQKDVQVAQLSRDLEQYKAELATRPILPPTNH